MNELMNGLLLNLPGFRLYAVCAVVLALKMAAVGGYTARVRAKHKVILNPEDASLAGTQVATAEHPEVERVLRAHRNDLENIPIFLILGLVAILAGAPLLGLQIALVVFTIARVGHSIAYLRGMQPWRSASYGIASLCTLVLMVMILVRAFS